MFFLKLFFRLAHPELSCQIFNFIFFNLFQKLYVFIFLLKLCVRIIAVIFIYSLCVFVFCYPKFPPHETYCLFSDTNLLDIITSCILTMFLKQYRFPAFLLESCCLLTHRRCFKAFIHWMLFLCKYFKKNILNR